MPYIGKKPADAVLTADDITDGIVSASKIASNAVTTAKVNADAITNAKTEFTPGLVIKGDGSSADGKLILNCHVNTHGVGIQAPPHSAGATYTLTLPNDTGTSGQVLSTNGSGILSFIDAVETKPTITDSSQTIAPDTSQTFNITGTNFVSIPIVEFIKSDTGAITRASAVGFTSSTQLSITATLASGTYYVRVENNDGNAARSTNAIITASSAPSFSTAAGSLATVGAADTVSITVAASSDSNVTITETTSVLTSNSDTPNSTMNLTLSGTPATSASYTISGTAPNPSETKSYSFTLQAEDAEGQTTTRDFSIDVSVGLNNGGGFG
jgi:hypothetical protein